MTNFDMTMDMLAASTFHPDSVEQARKYLRDLKASHDALLVAIQGRFNDCQDQECNQCKDVRVLVKAAEGLK